MRVDRLASTRGAVSIVVLLAAMLCGTALAGPGWTITQLTNNTTDDEYSAISGTNVVWLHWDGHDYEVYSNFAGQLTDNNWDDDIPAISGTNVVWASSTATSWAIFSNYAGQLPNTIRGSNPDISGTNVVWTAWDGHDREIYSNFAGQLTNNDTTDGVPSISGTNVVWDAWDGSDWDVHSNFAGHLTDGGLDNGVSDVSGTNVVWVDIYDPGDPYHLSDICTNFGWRTYTGYEQSPAISGQNVVWESVGSGVGVIWTNFAGPVRENPLNDINPDISGTNVVWQGWDGNDWEIYMATYGDSSAIPAPGAVLLGTLGTGLVGWLRRRRTI